MKKWIFFFPISILLASTITSCRFAKKEQPVTADKVFVNGNIITIDEKNSIAEAVAVKDGRILAVGKTNDIDKYKGNSTVVVDLDGKTMLPGFIDGHSHFMELGRSKNVDLLPPPVGTVKSIAEIITALKKAQKERNVKPGEWINALGYDQDQLAEGRHPNRQDLDAAFPDNPVYLNHISGHMAVVNSYALKISGITAASKDPADGQIVKDKNGEPTGLLLEGARAALKRPPAKKYTLDEQLGMFDEQQQIYISQGVTTAQDGSTDIPSMILLQEAAAKRRLLIDMEALPMFPTVQYLIEKKQVFDTLENGLKIKGCKFFVDGSPQGKTAFFTKPYEVEVAGCSGNCRGIVKITQKDLDERILFCFEHNIQPYVHCNGDAAIDMYIEAIKKANRVYKNRSHRLRPVIIHSQFVRPDQLDEYKALGMIPSFFTNHAFFWGDVHVRNLGKERAYFLSPLKTAISKQLIFTNHTDFDVTPINQMFLLWTSVARQSRSGQIIGPAERVTVLEGLRAFTINGAYQYGEEKEKGSIEKGKKADLVILSDNPLKVNVPQIKDITVLETIKGGKTIYKKN